MEKAGLNLTNQSVFLITFQSFDWDQTLPIDKSDTDKSFEYFADRFHSLLDLHAPCEKSFQNIN